VYDDAEVNRVSHEKSQEEKPVIERKTLLQKLDTLLDEAARTQMWGSFEIEVRDGVPLLIRTVKTEKFQPSTGDKTRDYKTTR
jgi:hypothetical protein